MTTFRERETWLRSLPAPRQQELAVELASAIESGAALSAAGQPVGGLSRVAEAIRQAKTDVDVDLARHRLFSIPEMRQEDEPEGFAWFAYRATCAWIYAADSKCTSPGDGLVNTFKCVVDFLDAMDEAGGGGNHLLGLLTEALDGETPLSALRAQVQQAVASRTQ